MLPRYYDLLSIRPDASRVDIEAARDALLARYSSHAALGDRDAIRLVKAIEDASATLTDPQRRAAYDAALALVNAPQPAPPPDPLVPAQSAPTPSAPPASPRSPAPRRLPSPSTGEPTPARALPTEAPSQPPRAPRLRTEAARETPTPPHAPIVFLLFILDWLAKHALALRDGRPLRGEVLDRPTSPALPAPDATGVTISAAGWTFTVHDAFHAPALTANGRRLVPDGHWLLVRLAIHNTWPGHRALRAEDFAMMAAHRIDQQGADTWTIPLHAEATHAARLTLGLRATPAGRYGLPFDAHEDKETVVVFDLPVTATDAYLRLKPAAAIVDLAPVSPLPGLPGTLDGKTSRPAPLAPPARVLEITDVSLAPGPGKSRTATVTARAAPGAVCQIRVQYAHGPSLARGLAPAVAGPDGLVCWSWRVSSRTRAGEWPVTVVCGYHHALGTLFVQSLDRT